MLTSFLQLFMHRCSQPVSSRCPYFWPCVGSNPGRRTAVRWLGKGRGVGMERWTFRLEQPLRSLKWIQSSDSFLKPRTRWRGLSPERAEPLLHGAVLAVLVPCTLVHAYQFFAAFFMHRCSQPVSSRCPYFWPCVGSNPGRRTAVRWLGKGRGVGMERWTLRSQQPLRSLKWIQSSDSFLNSRSRWRGLSPERAEPLHHAIRGW